MDDPVAKRTAVGTIAAGDRARNADELGPHFIAGESHRRIAVTAHIHEFKVRGKCRIGNGESALQVESLGVTTGRVWYADRAELLTAEDGNPETVAPIHEVETGLRALVTEVYRARGGKGAELPGAAQISGRGRVDLRFGVDEVGELYVLTKPDGMIRKVVGTTVVTAPLTSSAAPAPATSGPPGGPGITRSQASALANPVPPTPASIAAGKAAYDATCAACHGDRGQGAVRAKLIISIIEEQNGKQAPDLTDSQWDHGSSDGEIYTVLKRGLPPTMMPGFDGAVSDENMWNIVNYLRNLASRK